MNKILIAAVAALSASAFAAPAAYAQRHGDHGGGNDRGGYQHRGDDNDGGNPYRGNNPNHGGDRRGPDRSNDAPRQVEQPHFQQGGGGGGGDRFRNRGDANNVTQWRGGDNNGNRLAGRGPSQPQIQSAPAQQWRGRGDATRDNTGRTWQGGNTAHNNASQSHWRDNNNYRGGRDYDNRDRGDHNNNQWSNNRWNGNASDDHRRDDHRYDRYRNTHRDFDHPRYTDWRRVPRGGYFDNGYAHIVGSYYHRNYFWWSYGGWNRPYRPWRVGYVWPSYLYWEPVPYDLYYELPPAPYGCRYVYYDGDILLIALATGVILDALMYY